MPTEMHKFVARLIWQSYSTLDIVAEIQQKFDLGDAAEHELFIKVGQLRNMIKEARELAPAAARKMLEDGYERKDIIDALKSPFLLSGFEVDGIVARAEATLKAEQK